MGEHKIITRIRIDGDCGNGYFDFSPLGYIELENHNNGDWDNSSFSIRIKSSKNPKSSIIKDELSDGFNYKDIYFTDTKGNRIEELILHID